jgi:hypothetical protein
VKAEFPKKQRRAKRARARQRPREGRHDLRQRYRERDLPAEHIGVATIEDPYTEAGHLDAEGNLNAAAHLAPAQHSDGSVAEGAPGWTPPRRPTMTVFVALKDDPVGRTHSRHQIDESQYQTARAYQLAADKAMLGTMRSIDLGRTAVSGGLPPDPLPDSRRKAMERLRAVLTHHYGTEGLGLTRAVLCDRQSVEQTARLRGAEGDREIWFWSRLFRRCLDVLAAAFGFATSVYRPRQPNGHVEQDPAEDPARHADVNDLADLRSRRGRPNGGVRR